MDECPHCGADGYENVGAGTPRICLACGYDDEHGVLGVCPGGLHPRDGAVCCRACYRRAPIDLPGIPRWRSTRRSAVALSRRYDRFARHEADRIDAALTEWLRIHPVESLPAQC